MNRFQRPTEHYNIKRYGTVTNRGNGFYEFNGCLTEETFNQLLQKYSDGTEQFQPLRRFTNSVMTLEKNSHSEVCYVDYISNTHFDNDSKTTTVSRVFYHQTEFPISEAFLSEEMFDRAIIKTDEYTAIFDKDGSGYYSVTIYKS